MKSLFECGECGVMTEDRSHLCSPQSVDSMSDYCGSSGNKHQGGGGILLHYLRPYCR